MEDDLLPMHEDEPAGDFDIVLRGYDRRQVNDHLARFEAALGEAHDRGLVVDDHTARRTPVAAATPELLAALLDVRRRSP